MNTVVDFRVFGLKAVPWSVPQVFAKKNKAGAAYGSSRKNPALVQWQAYVKAFAVDAMGATPPSLAPLWVRLEFSLKAADRELYGLVCSPEIVWNGEKEEWVKKGHTIPDTDNLSKSVLDAMQGTVFGNDAQVGILVATRRYGPDDAVRVKVCEISKEELPGG